jgi:hypothetical protein
MRLASGPCFWAISLSWSAEPSSAFLSSGFFCRTADGVSAFRRAFTRTRLKVVPVQVAGKLVDLAHSLVDDLEQGLARVLALELRQLVLHVPVRVFNDLGDLLAVRLGEFIDAVERVVDGGACTRDGASVGLGGGAEEFEGGVQGGRGLGNLAFGCFGRVDGRPGRVDDGSDARVVIPVRGFSLILNP